MLIAWRYHEHLNYELDPDKKVLLKKHREVTFEAVVEILKKQGPIEGVEYPSREKYLHQKIYVVEIEKYAY